MNLTKSLMALLALVSGAAVTQTSSQPLPDPVLHFTGHEHYSTSSGKFVRYRLEVINKSAYPATLFAPAPGLPPCGANKNASRTWVDFFAMDGKRLYGFCALGSSQNLGMLWFALPEGQDPPLRVYIEMVDRQTKRTYRSNTERVN